MKIDLSMFDEVADKATNPVEGIKFFRPTGTLKALPVELTKVTPRKQWVANSGKSYEAVELRYDVINSEGRPDPKIQKLVTWGDNGEVADKAEEFKAGDIVTLVMVKNAQYWAIVDIEEGGELGSPIEERLPKVNGEELDKAEFLRLAATIADEDTGDYNAEAVMYMLRNPDDNPDDDVDM